MIQTLIPRPVAWVLSENADSTFNVAPLSFFNGVSSEPPVLMISVGWKEDGVRKDTWANIAERAHFVVHIPPVDQAREAVQTSAELRAGESELSYAGVSTIPVEGEVLPRLLGPKAAFFCRRRQILEVGDQALILGDIQRLWVDDTVVQTDGHRIHVDPVALAPLARLGGKQYCGLGTIFELERPKVAR